MLGVHAQPGVIKDNEVLARNFAESGTLERYEKLPTLFAEEGIYLEMPSGRKFTGREEIRNHGSATLSGIPDTRTEVISVVANEKTAVVEWTMSGTNTVGWPNIPASGKSFRLPVVWIMEIEDGLIVRIRDYWDWQTFHSAVSSE